MMQGPGVCSPVLGKRSLPGERRVIQTLINSLPPIVSPGLHNEKVAAKGMNHSSSSNLPRELLRAAENSPLQVEMKTTPSPDQNNTTFLSVQPFLQGFQSMGRY